MILLIHQNETVVEIIDLETNQSIDKTIKSVTNALFDIAEKYREHILIWCHESKKGQLNFEGLNAAFYLKNMMLSYSENQYLPPQIGYVEDSPFLKVNKNVKYPTWHMSSNIGAIHASQLLKFQNQINLNQPLDFVLNSIAKLGMPNGLFCYSEPRLLINNDSYFPNNQASFYNLFKFVKQHYRSIWSILLLINVVIYDKKFPVLAFIRTFFEKKIKFSLTFHLESLKNQKVNEFTTIDVIIPTLGRKNYLYDVLLDLAKQTVLPKQVIIIEQNEDETSESELDFIQTNSWPFKIIHEFIHQTGACNARNLALSKVVSDYVYLADDDNRFESTLLKTVIDKMKDCNFEVITMSYLQQNEVEIVKNPVQWNAFGGGCSVISSKFLNDVKFNMAYEHGYGEDTDFGMQLRNLGTDVIYMPNIKILHLKAPIGGFRTEFIHSWEKQEGIRPKPSPTVMLSRMNHTTKYQLLGYKTNLFIKFYKSQKIKNPIKYYKTFKKQWLESIRWANQLKSK
ncbi:glycosyltransferase family 2 protein [Flaviramulus sp. BrNp1-15]|uniref:glycosyltransferase family 2 protein n=1 Tax=Flaviramulus sp. BrNp1-15 TaxID=2916754 RepID=UPI001EE95E9D|nr:glycosyltransferase family A protein [Flaviramulus sp. BrNp1-15]ULC60580.1 glycosyltransferase family 2 protein [Flaviramulus sp. BrNp1-15]